MKKLGIYLKNLHPFLDILCIQEHKLRQPKFEVGFRLWKHALVLGKEANSTYGHGAGRASRAGSGGICILVSSRIRNLGPLYIRARAQSKAGPIHLHMGLHLGHFFGIGPVIEPSNIKRLGPSVGPKPLINHLK